MLNKQCYKKHLQQSLPLTAKLSPSVSIKIGPRSIASRAPRWRSGLKHLPVSIHLLTTRVYRVPGCIRLTLKFTLSLTLVLLLNPWYIWCQISDGRNEIHKYAFLNFWRSFFVFLSFLMTVTLTFYLRSPYSNLKTASKLVQWSARQRANRQTDAQTKTHTETN